MEAMFQNTIKIVSKVNNPAANDWRRQGQESYLMGVTLFKRSYRLYSPSWDHDHCEFCGVKFSLQENDVKRGYATEDDYYWICDPCFNDFKTEFNWDVKAEV